MPNEYLGQMIVLNRIAVLMTCYNRRDLTLKCLGALKKQEFQDHIILKTYLVDDASIDGTGEVVRKNFPAVQVLQGDGNLYWGGGMRFAWKEAFKGDYDYYLWLNDDTILHKYAIQVMLNTEKKIKGSECKNSIIVGSICDPLTNEHTYGGVNQYRSWFSIGFKPVMPSDKPIKCDTFNGNLVLVPKDIFSKIGTLSKDFTHNMGDFDYGLKAKEKGILICIAPGYLGKCSRNPDENTWKDSDISFTQRKKLQNSPTGLPENEWLFFLRTHYGYMWIVGYVKLKLRLIFPHIYSYLKKIFQSCR